MGPIYLCPLAEIPVTAGITGHIVIKVDRILLNHIYCVALNIQLHENVGQDGFFFRLFRCVVV